MSDMMKLLLGGTLAILLCADARADDEAAPEPATKAVIGDPMRPSYLGASRGNSTAAAPSWRVESIVVSPQRRVAVINGRSLGVGDYIQGARVAAIDAYAVTLDINGKRRQLTLTDARIKTQAE